MKFSEFLNEQSQQPIPVEPNERGNYILSLQGWREVPLLPVRVYGYVDLSGNKIRSLKGSPESVEKYFTCDDNELGSLEGAPLKCGSFFSCKSNQLYTLKGAPKEISGVFDADFNNLTSAEGITPITTAVYLSNNNFTSLHNIHKHIQSTDQLFIDGNPINSHVLGLLLIKNLKFLNTGNDELDRIIGQYLPNRRGNDAVFECQQELIDAGLDDFAQL